MALSLRSMSLALMAVGLTVASLGAPCMAQASKEELDAAEVKQSPSSKYQLLDVSDRGHEIGDLSEKPSADVQEKAGSRDPDATYLLQEFDKENEMAMK